MGFLIGVTEIVVRCSIINASILSLFFAGMHENISEVSDMLNVLNMDILERALNAYTTEEECIKAGLKESLFWLLLKTADAVKAM